MIRRATLHETMGESQEDSPSNYPRSGTQKTRDEAIIAVFKESSDEYLSTAEVAEALPIGQRATHNRLTDLQKRGRIERKPLGAGTIWRLAPADEPESEQDQTAVDVLQHRSPRAGVDWWTLGLWLGLSALVGSAILLLFIIALAVTRLTLPIGDLGIVVVVAGALSAIGILTLLLIAVRRAVAGIRGPRVRVRAWFERRRGR